MKKRTKFLLFFSPIIIGLVAMCFGRYSVSLKDIFLVFFNGDVNAVTKKIILDIRLPRILCAMLVGAGLSIAGSAFQSLFSNPLATPDTVGVASGASFGAALAILLNSNFFVVEIMAIVFGLFAVFLTFFISKDKKMNLSFVILAGIMVSSLFSSFVSLIKYVADPDSKLPEITFWLMGTLSTASFKNMLITAPLITISIIIIYLCRWHINLLTLTEDELKTTGINVNLFRYVIILLSTIITASVVSMCGQVGFVALITPHICKMIFKHDNLKVIPASISIGASFMIIVDTISRASCSKEIPISIITSIIGAPFFIFLIRHIMRREL